MPTHALLGATGGTGTAILRALLATPPPNLTLNIFIRSKAKLLSTFPNLQTTSNIRITIIEAPLTSTTALRQTLADASVIYMCIATNDASPGCRIARDTADAILPTLRSFATSSSPPYKKPTILILRSVSFNPYAYSRLSPWNPGPAFVKFCLHNVYSDLAIACDQYTAEPELLDYVFVDPPALHDSEGAECTGHELLLSAEEVGGAKESLNYADLGAAFVEIAGRREEFRGKAVVVSATGKVRENWPVLLGYIGRGLKARVWG